MKIKSMFFSLLLGAVALAFLANCSGNKSHNHDDHAAQDSTASVSESPSTSDTASPQFSVDANFQTQLASVFIAYIEMKNAFVASNAAQVKEKAKGTDEALTKVDMKLLTGAAHHDWMNYLSSLQNALKEIQSSNDIEVQRKAFSNLSDNLYKSVKAFGLGGKEAFYEYCPMAFDNEGAYWLSEEDQIKNPYFGDAMLTCGEVKEKLK